MKQETLRRFCRKEAKEARANIHNYPFGKGELTAFDRGYNLGLAHAYELLLKHKLKDQRPS